MNSLFEKHSVTRRNVLRGGAAVGTLSLASTLPGGAVLAQGRGEVFFACNGGSTQRIMEQIILPRFTELTGIKVNYVAQQPADSVAKLQAQRGTSGLDMIWLAGATTYVAIDEGLLQAFDPAQLPNAQNIKKGIGRKEEILPIAVSGNALLYNKEIFAENGWDAPTSWFDLWDPKFAGHTCMYGMNSTGGVEMLLQVSKELTGGYENLDAAFAKMAELAPNIYEFFPSAGAWETAFQQGEVWLGVNSYTRAIQLTQSGLPVGTVLPAAGVPSHELHVGLVKDAGNSAQAHALANYLLSAEAQQMIATNLGYSPSTTGVEIPDELKPFYPNDDLAWFPDWPNVSKRFGEIVDRWQREVER